MVILQDPKAIFQLPPNNIDLFVNGRQIYYRSNMEFVDGILPISHGGTGMDGNDLTEGNLLAYKNGTFVSSSYTETYFEEMEERFRELGGTQIAKADGTMLAPDEKTGVITLPDYLSHEGGNLSGSLNYSKRTATFLDGAKGDAFYNSTVTKGKHQVLAKFNSINGVFMDGVYNNQRLVQYMSNETIAANQNEVTHQLVLLGEDGNSKFPGKVTAESFTGDLYGTAEYAYDANSLGGKSPAYYLDFLNLTGVPDDMDKPVSNAQAAAIKAEVTKEKERAEREEAGIRNTISTNKPIWDDKYTKNEVDNLFQMAEQKIDWKESVDTFDDIATTYPHPEDGWRVTVKDTDIGYQWDGKKWIAVTVNSIPKATQSVDGLLSKEDKINYDDANRRKHDHSNKALLDRLDDAYLDKVPNVATDDQVVSFQETPVLRELISGEKIKISFGKIAKFIKELMAHLVNKENPHEVTVEQLNLENVDNTSDVNKPVSNATQAALDLKADIESPELTGTPSTPTANTDTKTGQIASTRFVHNVVTNALQEYMENFPFDSIDIKGKVWIDCPEEEVDAWEGAGNLIALPVTYDIGWAYRLRTDSNAYEVGESVAYNGDLLVAMAKRTNAFHGEDWMVLSHEGVKFIGTEDNIVTASSEDGRSYLLKHKTKNVATPEFLIPEGVEQVQIVKEVTADAQGHLESVKTANFPLVSQKMLESAVTRAKNYTDEVIDDLVGGASSAMDTLKEIEEAYQNHQEVADALTEAIGTKAGKDYVDNKIGEIKKYQKYVNVELDYSILELNVQDNIILAYNMIIPFDYCDKLNGVTFNESSHSVRLNKGKTYKLTCDLGLLFTNVSISHGLVLAFYDITNNVSIATFRKTTEDISGCCTNMIGVDIISPGSDIDVCVKVIGYWGTANSIAIMTKVNNIRGRVNHFFMVEEIGRAIAIDPLEHVDKEKGVEDTPVGHIMSYMGTRPPKHYLSCDGAIYNIADYPYLSQHIRDSFGSYGYFGGDGTNTFAVPDLRGEFLRGTGTAARNTGSGAAIGEHQDGTKHRSEWFDSTNNASVFYRSANLADDHYTGAYDTWLPDKVQSPVNQDSFHGYKVGLQKYTSSGEACVNYTGRPTNTSVLYCIKYEPTYFTQFHTHNYDSDGANFYDENRHVPTGGEAGQALVVDNEGHPAWSSDVSTKVDDYSITKDANGRLMTKRFKSEQIPANADLNDLWQPGLYDCPLNATVYSLKNCPTRRAFSMLVRYAAGIQGSCIQEITEYGGGEHSIAFRRTIYKESDGTEACSNWIVSIDANNLMSQHASTPGNKHIPAGGRSGQILRWSADGTAAWGRDNNTVYSVATTSANGLLSAADKTKLDGIATGANKYIHPTTAGNVHVPAGGAAGNILTWKSAGVAQWAANNAVCSQTLGRSGSNAYPMTFHWNGQGGYPSWYWGGNDGTNMYVFNPLNLPFLRNDVASILVGGSRFPFDNALYFGSDTSDQYTSLIFKSTGGEVSTTPNEYVYPMVVRMDPRYDESDILFGSYSSSITQYAPIYSIHPRVPSHYYVGDTNAPFAGFNSMTALRVISDKRKKKNLVKIDEWYHPLKNFLKELAPYWYQLVSQVDDAVHMGFLAQEVEELMKKYNIPEKWSLLNKTQKRDDDGNFIDDYNYSLCYEQLIPLLLFVLQKEVLELPKS